MAKLWLKYTSLIVYILVLISVGVLTAMYGSNICMREECIKKAKRILSSMKSDASPCHDFFEFACGNYVNLTKYRKQGFASILAHIGYDIQDAISNYMLLPLKVTDDRLLKIIKKMYQPCENVNLVDKQGIKPIWDALWLIGGVPVVEGKEWNEKDFSLGNIEAKTLKTGFNGRHIFETFVAQDEEDKEKCLIHLKPPKVPDFPGSELVTRKLTEKLLFFYQSFIVRLTFFLLNKPDYEASKYDKMRDQFIEELNKTLDFKINLYKHLQMYMLEQDPINLYNRMSLERLQSEFPYVNWQKFFKDMLPSTAQLPKEVVVIGTSYFKPIKELLKKTPKRTIANYLMMECLIEGSLFLPSVYFSIYSKFRFNIDRRGVTAPKRSEICNKVVREKLQVVIASLFVQTYNFTGMGSQNILERIANEIKQQLKYLIKQIKWMDEKTKEGAYLKIKKLKFKLSLSDDQIKELGDEESRAKYYEDLCLGRRASHVLPSYFCINKFHLRKNWELLEKKPTAFDVRIDVFSTQFKYEETKNEILVPYGMLKFPVFNSIWPAYLNYGGVGSILGQILAKGFDADGAEYNDLGFQKMWWTNDTMKLYQEQAKCYKDQFDTFALVKSNYSIKETPFRLDNLRRFEGINLASQVYSKYAERSFLREQGLPGLEMYNPNQLLFIGFANEFCSFVKPKYELHIFKKGIITNEFKVSGSVSNMKKFSEAFNCSSGDKMNPEKKCNFL